MIGLEVAHHDGSELYVSELHPELGTSVTLFVRIPRDWAVDGVWVRAVPDGEAQLFEARVDRVTPADTWWRAEMPIKNLITNYRFVIRRGRVIEWLTQAGMQWWEPTDANDFRIVAYAPSPPWARDAVFYEIFPDRFAPSGVTREAPAWAIPAAWDDPLHPDPAVSTRQLYGGDLDGVVSRLDHIAGLGATALYLTPIFPANSAHRYNASSFSGVDPLLGGDEALVRLTTAAHARGMRVICDFTSNHCGDTHEWFQAAQQDPTSPEATFFYFNEHPHEYASWLGFRALPKFDHSNPELRRRLYEGPDSVFGRWLQGPYDIDGWRIDVANMSGRYAHTDLNNWIARSMRMTMFMTKPEAFLLAEHFFDATRDLLGDGWHGVMNYAGFARPVWQWLAQPEVEDKPWFPVIGPTSGVISYLTMRDFLAAVPWTSALNNFNLLDSHDTTRFLTLTGDPAVARVGAGLMMTFVGIPMIFAGDEIGMDGRDSDDTRKPMPWDTARWDSEMLAWYRSLVALRNSSPALRRGGLRWVVVADDTLAFLRETADERLLVQAARRPHVPAALDASALGISAAENLVGGGEARVADGKLTLPGDGPAFNVWRLS